MQFAEMFSGIFKIATSCNIWREISLKRMDQIKNCKRTIQRILALLLGKLKKILGVLGTLILVDKMAELDEVVENPVKQPIKPSIFVHFLKICGSIACKIWSNCSGPIRIMSLNPRVSCIFSSFIVINISRSFRFFINSRVSPRSEPWSSSKIKDPKFKLRQLLYASVHATFYFESPTK